MPGIFAGSDMQVIDSIQFNQQTDTVVSQSGLQDSLSLPASDSLPATVNEITSKTESNINQNERIVKELTREQQTVRVDTFPYANLNWNNASTNFLIQNSLSGIPVPGEHEILHLGSEQKGFTRQQPISPAERNRVQEDWLTGLLLLIVLLFIAIRSFYGKVFTQLADSLTNYHISSKLYQEKNVLTKRVNLVLDTIYFVVFSVFIFEFNRHFGILNPKYNGFFLFGAILAILILYSLIRIILLHLTGFLFDSRSLFSEYIHHSFIFNKGLGIVLFPVCIAVLFIQPGLVKYFIYLGIFIVALAFILKTIRSLKIILWKDVLLFYLILYLCTLEILPLLLGYRVMKSMILSY